MRSSSHVMVIIISNYWGVCLVWSRPKSNWRIRVCVCWRCLLVLVVAMKHEPVEGLWWRRQNINCTWLLHDCAPLLLPLNLPLPCTHAHTTHNIDKPSATLYSTLRKQAITSCNIYLFTDSSQYKNTIHNEWQMKRKQAPNITNQRKHVC